MSRTTPKPGTLTAFVHQLGTENPGMSADEMYKSALRLFPKARRGTVLSLRSTLGFTTGATPSNAKSAAPSRSPAARETEFRRMVAQMGTDRARELLEAAETRQID